MKPYQVGALVLAGVIVVLCCWGITIISVVFG